MTTPTADIDENAPRIESKYEFVEYLASGGKPKTDWRIGTEHEKFGFLKDGLRPLPYEGEASVSAVLHALKDKFGWEPISEGEHLIGLQKDGASVSLEPGGQFELSGAPLEHIHQTCNEVGRHLEEVKQVSDHLGVAFLGLGFSPIWSLEETPLMPKGRYKIMRDYMRKVGRLGQQMMFRSCTVQTNLDFADEADMVKKYRVSLALQPLGTALFANSPFAEGRPNGYQSYRANVWTDTDPDRTGMLPFVFEDGFGFERYVDYALDVPMYFIRRDGGYLNCAGLSFRDFMKGELPARPGELPTLEDFKDHISTIFPEVRLKTFLEMRGSDSGPWDRICALPAFWVGILYDSHSLDGAWDLVKHWTPEQRETMRRAAPALGLKTPLPNGEGTLQDLALEVLKISRYGLKARGMLSTSGDDETGFLSELDLIAESGQTPAERMLRRYHEKWNRDLSHVFEEYAF
ncbi:glutamate--cysteine ligase [Ponticaulis sp.]|uniref:glutamate--cysteine ligase n=1 Tax=Ponticaulis sp. TaxID=2020902 RepID=UPI000B6D0DCD|nr:glutamate--cysteine ligase [Ponticaulis sp.]MAI90858.1 glutamate--cysteine ligase [Ponticaulis sp.]OUX98833.1 MAG: glutamate--cysteine ligase [Hyphomonadaceae bacterium TMED5]|tara:strand:- start:21913 stop:23295 length:1383 start_codon:yes stop_codon:yes gene_type:complete